jgi:hypothetical protein
MATERALSGEAAAADMASRHEAFPVAGIGLDLATRIFFGSLGLRAGRITTTGARLGMPEMPGPANGLRRRKSRWGSGGFGSQRRDINGSHKITNETIPNLPVAVGCNFNQL